MFESSSLCFPFPFGIVIPTVSFPDDLTSNSIPALDFNEADEVAACVVVASPLVVFDRFAFDELSIIAAAATAAFRLTREVGGSAVVTGVGSFFLSEPVATRDLSKQPFSDYGFFSSRTFRALLADGFFWCGTRYDFC